MSCTSDVGEDDRDGRDMWVWRWIFKRPSKGYYSVLLVELRNKDPRSFQNFMRMSPAMYDEIVEKLTPRITETDHQLERTPRPRPEGCTDPPSPCFWCQVL